MKILCITVAIVLLNAGMTLMAQVAQSIPDFDQVNEVVFQTAAGWYLDIKPDGSGVFGYGSSGGDFARFPKQTFVFKELYDLLVPRLSEEGNIRDAAAVFLHIKGLSPGTPTYALSLYDKAIIKKIMSLAVEKSVPFEPKRFNELLKNHPPFPPDVAT